MGHEKSSECIYGTFGGDNEGTFSTNLPEPLVVAVARVMNPVALVG